MDGVYQKDGDLYFVNPNKVLQLEKIRIEGNKVLLFQKDRDEPCFLSSKEEFVTNEEKGREIERLVQLNQSITQEHLESFLFLSTFSLLQEDGRRERERVIERIARHPLFVETKIMLEKAVGEELTDDQASTIIHMYNRGKYRLCESDFTDEEWALHSLAIDNAPKREESALFSKYEDYMYRIYHE
ncbi:Hypothetical protein BRZCDTV_425 [Brazilian cedratvirus IHUMI]|uniref:Uncharacterized protein n=1 Tax=Brazilian cedratvirus IHUMI TaxID=2126980 RepID=A0A2R8FF10_9VIRU|nr:Hypothetical protein BRZCDTV_425 [Brazilian cedratvirus IHUMI]